MASTHNNGSPLFDKAMKNLFIAAIAILILLLYGPIMNGSHSNASIPFFLVGFLVMGYFGNQASKLFSGSWGEHKALSKLEMNLPDGFHIFTNINVHERMESDMVVVGPTGVFVLEVKNLNGTIEGSERDKQWILHKVGQRGGEYSKSMKNPLGQMRRNVYIISQYLKMENCPAWVEGFVLFPNSNTKWEDDIPQKCLTSGIVDRIGELLSRYPARKTLSKEQIDKIASCLSKCQGGAPAMRSDDFEKKSEALKKHRKESA